MANLISCRFEICRKLGQGTYGKVQLGINKETGQQVGFDLTKKNVRNLKIIVQYQKIYLPNLLDSDI